MRGDDLRAELRGKVGNALAYLHPRSVVLYDLEAVTAHIAAKRADFHARVRQQSSELFLLARRHIISELAARSVNLHSVEPEPRRSLDTARDSTAETIDYNAVFHNRSPYFSSALISVSRIRITRIVSSLPTGATPVTKKPRISRISPPK